MKAYPHIISKLFYEPLLISPHRHRALCQVIEARMAENGQISIAKPDDELEEETTMQVGETVIIPVHGTIMRHADAMESMSGACSLDKLNAQIDMAEHDPNVSRIIFDFRTPGGEVTGVPETGRKIYSSKKETVAFCDSECCSGGLWLASQCRAFYGTPSSNIGSVGVYTLCLDYSEQLKQDGVKVEAIFAGKFKLLGAYWKPLTDTERTIMQVNVDRIYEQFKLAVGVHREVADSNYGNGLVFDGESAAAIGFTDGCVDSMDELLDELTD